jgi:hypothetical protein
MYLFDNPYRICRKFLEKKGVEDPYRYGETPFETILKISDEANIVSTDHFYDLGCGRGLVSLYVSSLKGCRAVGIDEIPKFVKRANFAAKILKINAKFLIANYLKTNLTEASIIYLYGTMLEDEEIIDLCKRFNEDQKIISISYPLSDYDQRYKVIKTFQVSFPWGETSAYVNQR